MTIDEAIAHEREVAAIQRNNDKLNKTLGKSSPYYNTDCLKCAEEHEQLASWLEELKAYREKKCDKSVYLASKSVDKIDAVNKGYIDGYNKAIDDCKELTFREVVYCDSLNDRTEFRELAEQLKAKNNERKGVTEK